ncbi:hypothetical protein QFC19_008634 [Naganishia cerealis]|uniref:Uncharacterized protein n=1 Tax=Naganishia cerealis TaxID=610337 RepID=A0ACC2V046_9TREE|nr:hypothetical protein QFC19_008634 [Naganishia cerealis]
MSDHDAMSVESEQARAPPASALVAPENATYRAIGSHKATPSSVPSHVQSSFGGPASPYAYSPVITSRRRGRPKKYFTPEDRQAEKNRRRRERERARKAGEDPVDVPPRSANYTAPKPYDRDYGKYDISDPDAMTARDVVVDWLATDDTYIKWLQASTFMDKAVLTKQIQDKLAEHGMLERDASSLRQHIGILMKGCEDAKKFEKDGTSTNIPISDTKRFNYLLSTGISQEEAYTRFRWPYYQKLKHLAQQVTVPPPPVYPHPATLPHPPTNTTQLHGPSGLVSTPSGSRSAPSYAHQDHANDNGRPMDFDDHSLNLGHHWDGPDDSASPGVEFGSNRSAGPSQSAPTASANNPFPLPATQLSPKHEPAPSQLSAAVRNEMLAIERERWELQKQEARQKLELEKEQMRRNEKIQEQESHIQLVKMFRGLIADGLTKNQAGRVVWREKWSAIKAEMDQDDE